VSVTTDKVGDAQSRIEDVLARMTKRWSLDEIVTNTGKPSEIYYLLRLRKSIPRDVFLTAVHQNAEGFIATADLESGVPVEEKKDKKDKKDKTDGANA